MFDRIILEKKDENYNKKVIFRNGINEFLLLTFGLLVLLFIIPILEREQAIIFQHQIFFYYIIPFAILIMILKIFDKRYIIKNISNGLLTIKQRSILRIGDTEINFKKEEEPKLKIYESRNNYIFLKGYKLLIVTNKNKSKLVYPWNDWDFGFSFGDYRSYESCQKVAENLSKFIGIPFSKEIGTYNNIVYTKKDYINFIVFFFTIIILIIIGVIIKIN